MNKTLATLALFLLTASAVAFSQGARPYLKVSDKAPDFALPNGDGKLVSLSELLTRTPVVVIFYRGFW